VKKNVWKIKILKLRIPNIETTKNLLVKVSTKNFSLKNVFKVQNIPILGKNPRTEKMKNFQKQ
jgi:hypothetical protein